MKSIHFNSTAGTRDQNILFAVHTARGLMFSFFALPFCVSFVPFAILFPQDHVFY